MEGEVLMRKKRKPSLEIILLALLALPSIACGNGSPEQGKIAFDYHGYIYIMDTDGSDRTQVASGAFPAWSPDGSKIAFLYRPDGDNEIYIVDADGSNQIRLTDNPAWDSKPSWSPLIR